ncbi:MULTISPECIES: tyrosine-type recombinase/integrase [unclassified Clostridioides]|uniref:tyrosine-type recombinase/integrase n=2 Tax=Clostridioides TaxID=1870884 RepID=UPI001D0F93B0
MYKYIQESCEEYNKCNKKNKLLNMTPHILRHTFCTNMTNKGMTPNNLQYVINHKNIEMTLSYYEHGSYQSALTEIRRIIATT